MRSVNWAHAKGVRSAPFLLVQAFVSLLLVSYFIDSVDLRSSESRFYSLATQCRGSLLVDRTSHSLVG